MLDKIGGRKVMIATVFLLIGLALYLIKGDLSGNMASYLEWLFSAFVTGNAIEHVSGAIKAHAPKSDANQVTVDMGPIAAKIDTLQQSELATSSSLKALVKLVTDWYTQASSGQ